MGTTICGAGSGSEQGAMAGTLTIKNVNDARARVAALSTGKKKTTKQLNYSYREISGQLLRAKKAQGASSVLTRAKSKVSTLQRLSATGQYDSKDMATALAHARRMVRCVQLKVRNLREEEREQSSHRDEGNAKVRQKKSEVKRRVAQKEKKIEQKVQIETTQEIISEKRKRQEMMQKRARHRAQERGKIAEADMKYIKALADDGKLPYTGNSSDASGVIMDLSSEATALSMTEEQIEAQVEQELAASMGGDVSDFTTGADAAVSGMSTGMSAQTASVGATIDISM